MDSGRGVDIGGLIGLNSGASINNTYATGNVYDRYSNNVGGLVGINYLGTINESYAHGDVEGKEYVGSLVGLNKNNSSGSVEHSYATGEVTGTSYVGGFIGENSASTINVGFFDKDSTNQINGVGGGYNNGMKGLSTPQMTDTAAYYHMSGFDFLNVWSLTKGYPELRWQNVDTIATPFDKPTLLYPGSRDSEITTMPTLKWNPISRVNSYTLQISDNSSFSTLLINQSLSNKTLTLNKPLKDNTLYFWRIIASNQNYSIDSQIWKFTTRDTLFSSDISLNAPIKDSVLTTIKPQFAWKFHPDTSRFNDTGAIHYDIYLSKDSLFNNITPIRIDSSGYVPKDSLIDNNIYFWKVKAIATDDSTTSAVARFFVDTQIEAPNAFKIISPNGPNDFGTRPKFTWNKATENDPEDTTMHYKLIISQDSIFKQVIRTIPSLSDTTIIISKDLNKSTQYYWRVEAINGDSLSTSSDTLSFTVGTVTAINKNGNAKPTKYALSQNYPNPFNPTTEIKYALPKAENVRLQIFNTLGQLVYTLIDKQQSAGYYQVQFDASKLSSGVYLYRLQAGEHIMTKKMILLK